MHELHCFSFQFFIMLLAFLLFQGQWSSVECVRLDPRGAKYVRELVNEFIADPTSSRFDQIILPPQIGEELSDFLHPKVYIWCPITHWKIEVKCPLHGCQLTPGTFTDVVDKTSPKNPRLVYDLRGNVLMVQRIYLCRHKENPHRYLSSSETILRSIPSLYGHACFPILMLYRSACSKNLVDHLETQILQGVSFLKTCEGLAAINFKEFSHRLRRYTLSAKSNVTDTAKLYEKFYADPMFSFPSNDLLMHIFLADFQGKEPYYEVEMKKRALHSRVISCDHTFKISKYIGARRSSDDKFVKQFENLFIVLNERHEVISWRLTRTTGFEEIRSLFVELKEQIGNTLDAVIVDDCCKVRTLYRSVFPDVEVKLDLFHAIQRVIKKIPKGSEFSKRFSKELGLIFRANGDCDDVRQLPTPDCKVVIKNLHSFRERWKSFLNMEEMKKARLELDHLSVHIKKGCLSGLKPGEGTESNERLHNTLNKSLLCGATTTGPEIAIAIISLLFYSMNCRKRAKKHKQNSRVIPFVPLFSQYTSRNVNDKNPHFNTNSGGKVTLDDAWNAPYEGNKVYPDETVEEAVVVIETIEDTLNESIASLLLKNMSKLHSILSKVNSECRGRCFNAFDIPIKQVGSKQVLVNSCYAEDDTEIRHRETLQRNLDCFSLKRDEVVGDGDCAFRTIISQVRKTNQWSDPNSALCQHISYLGLGRTADEDVNQLRQLFVNNVQSNEHYQMLTGIPSDEMNTETERFREPGTFCGEVGDLIIKVCSDILQVPIIVVTSINGSPYVPFIPDDALITNAIYIAYTAFGPGHYDGTLPAEKDTVSTLTETKRPVCSCGKNNKEDQDSCIATVDGKTRCPCVETRISCTRDCRCKGCRNKESQELCKVTSNSVSCRCGVDKSRKNVEYVACVDGKRKTKCPCVRARACCGLKCSCRNCGNCDNKPDKVTDLVKIPAKRKRESPVPFKKRRSAEYLASNSTNPSAGPWTTHETCLLFSTMQLIEATVVDSTLEGITSLYNYVANSHLTKKGNFPIRSKNQMQLLRKVTQLKKRQAVISALGNK